MGGYSNGVYVPVLGEVGWDDELNDFLTVSGRERVNVMLAPYSAQGDGVSDDTAAITAASIAAGPGGAVFFPTPLVSYHLASGSSLEPLNGQHWYGPAPTPGSPNGAKITCANAYGILSTASSLTGITISNLYVSLRAGSTSGGAIKLVGPAYFSQCMLRGLQCEGQTTSTDPLVHVKGWIGSWMDAINVSTCGGHGIKIEAVGAGSTASNASSVTRCRVSSAGGGSGGSTTAALYLSGTKHIRVIDNTIESNDGYGIWADNSISPLIEGNWFEDNFNHDLYLNDGYATTVVGNIFNANASGSAADHIKATCAASNIRPHHAIISNHMNDHAASGVDIRLGANVTHSVVMSNRNASVADGTIVDSGGANHITANDRTTGIPDDDYYPGNIRHRFGVADASHDWVDIRGDGASDTVLSVYRGSASTTNPRMILHPNLTVDGVGSYTGLVLGKRSDSTDPKAHGGAVFAGTDVAGLAAGDGSALVTGAYVRADTFATTTAATKLGFRGSTPVTKATVTGSRGANAALADLLTKLAALGLITDGTS